MTVYAASVRLCRLVDQTVGLSFAWLTWTSNCVNSLPRR